MKLKISLTLSFLMMQIRNFSIAQVAGHVFAQVHSGAKKFDQTVTAASFHVVSPTFCAIMARNAGGSVFSFTPRDPWPGRCKIGHRDILGVGQLVDGSLDQNENVYAVKEDNSASSPAGNCISQSTAPCNDLDIGILYLHETDCTKYYECVYGTVHLRTCGANTKFNKLAGLCDYDGSDPCYCETP